MIEKNKSWDGLEKWSEGFCDATKSRKNIVEQFLDENNWDKKGFEKVIIIKIMTSNICKYRLNLNNWLLESPNRHSIILLLNIGIRIIEIKVDIHEAEVRLLVFVP